MVMAAMETETEIPRNRVQQFPNTHQGDEVPEYKTILAAHFNIPPAKGESAQTANAPGGAPDGPLGPQTPPPGEASALVARLLTGSDQEISAAGDTPFSVRRPEHAKSVPGPIPTEASHVTSPPAEKSIAVPASPPTPKAPLPQSHSNITASFVLLLSILIFGAGLGVGYGVFGRHSKAGANSKIREGRVAAVSNTALSKTADDQATTPNEQTQASIEAQLASPVSSSPAKTFSESGLGQRGTAQHSSTAYSRPPASNSATRMPLVADPVHPLPRAFGFTHSEPAIAASKPPDIPLTTALPTIVSLAPEMHAIPEPPSTDPGASAAASVGHLDPCQLIHSVQPVYPRKARRLHLEGNVELRAVVGVNGTVESVSVVNGPALLAPAAIDAARGFLYKAALLNGKPIETVQTINMSFKLKN